MLISQVNLVCDAFVCGGNTTYYSNSFEISHGFVFGIWYKAASSGTIALQIQMEQCYRRPTTEGASDTEWAVPATNTDIEAALAASSVGMKSLSPIFMPYARFKIIGGALNHASTTLTARFIVQEFTGTI